MKKALALLLCALLLVGCSGKTQPATETGAVVNEETLFTSGTYKGEADGFGGMIVVEVEVDAEKILAINVLEHSESDGISNMAFERVPAAIVANQSLLVDTVSGCTLSSQGLIDAVTNALKQATADIDKLKIEVNSTVKEGELIELEADVVVVGAGGAGMNAAVEVLKAGSSVIVLEKMPSAGGNTIRAGSAYNTSNEATQKVEVMNATEMEAIENILAMEPHDDMMKAWQATLAEELAAYQAVGSVYLFDSPTLHKLQTYIGGDFVGDPALIEILAENSLEGLQFLSEMGTEWEEKVNAAVGATWRRSHTPTKSYGASGSDFVLPQVEYVAANGGETYYEYEVTELVMEAGRVVGVRGVTASGDEFVVKANNGVVMATGGFGANVGMRQKYNQFWSNLDESIATNNHPGATGDGIIMAEAVGAQLTGMEWIQLIPTYGPGVFTPYIENQFYINKEGQRFINEDGRRDELAQAILSQTDSATYIISDANTVNGATKAYVDTLIGNGYAFVADTLEELADQIGVDPVVLQASADQFNEARTTGNDPFGRKVFDKEFGDGPFYAGLTSPMVHHTMGGIMINEEAQVIGADGNIILGLYAAGEVTGGVHGSNRLGGNAIADITVFGRIAGANAAAGK